MTPTLVLLTEEIVHHRTGYAQAIQGLVAELLLDTARAVVDATLPGPLDPAACSVRSPW